MKKRLSALLLSLLLLCPGLAGCVQGALSAPAVTPAPTVSLALLADENDGIAEEAAAPEKTAEAEALPTPDPSDGDLLALEPAATAAHTPGPTRTPKPTAAIDEDGAYTSKDDVALYIHTYGRLPDNFITKKEANALGWSGGGLDDYAYGKCIGGNRFGNYEGLLPEKRGRTYTECDVDTLHKRSRGAKRIIFSNDGLVYYTDDHYESFTLLYGEE